MVAIRKLIKTKKHPPQPTKAVEGVCCILNPTPVSGRNGVRVRWVTSRELSITQKVAPELTSATNHEKNVRLLVIRVYNVTVTYAIEKRP